MFNTVNHMQIQDYTCEAPDAAGLPDYIAESKAIRRDDIESIILQSSS